MASVLWCFWLSNRRGIWLVENTVTTVFLAYHDSLLQGSEKPRFFKKSPIHCFLGFIGFWALLAQHDSLLQGSEKARVLLKSPVHCFLGFYWVLGFIGFSDFLPA